MQSTLKILCDEMQKSSTISGNVDKKLTVINSLVILSVRPSICLSVCHTRA